MKVITIVSQKGGAGKTTLALHLAVAAGLDKQTAAIIDLDPQASATAWADSREKEQPAVISAQATRLHKILQTAEKEGVNIVFIDTAPHSESSALIAAKVADLILVPCRPAILDLRAISTTIDLIKLAQKPAFAVLNATPPRGSLSKEASDAIVSCGLEVAPVQIGQRTVFVQALTIGETAQEFEPLGKGAQEITELYKWLCKQVNVHTYKQENK